MSFDFDFTVEHLQHIIPNCKYDAATWHAELCDLLPFFEINTAPRVASFIAQTAHESGGYRALSENLNYSAKALDAVFGKYFVRAGRDANEYARQPEKIANVVYANRMGNGDTDSGDGWNYRGRGLIQLTGYTNYKKFADYAEMSMEDAIAYLETPRGAVHSACFFWYMNNCNDYADSGDIKGQTRRINGGYNGLEDRIHHYKEAMEMFGYHGEVDDDHADDHADAEEYSTLRKGMRGEGVKIMQEALGIGADGIFGPGTERALKAWQAANGLTADGIAGPMTLEKLLD